VEHLDDAGAQVERQRVGERERGERVTRAALLRQEEAVALEVLGGGLRRGRARVDGVLVRGVALDVVDVTGQLGVEAGLIERDRRRPS
jgi:hypothetical protein